MFGVAFGAKFMERFVASVLPNLYQEKVISDIRCQAENGSIALPKQTSIIIDTSAPSILYPFSKRVRERETKTGYSMTRSEEKVKIA